MPLQPTATPRLLLTPPLAMPVQLLNGYGELRRGVGYFADDPCNRYEAPSTDGSVPGDYIKYQIHEAVDLVAEPGDCVFAAYSGRVREVVSTMGGAKGHVTIDHHPNGMGLVTRYLHLEGAQTSVAVGDFVTKGQQISVVGAEPETPHLHFEVRTVVNRPGEEREADDATSTDEYWSDSATMPIDPTRLLYRWEEHFLTTHSTEVELPGPQIVGPQSPPALTIEAVEVEVADNNIPLFTITTSADTQFSVCLYEPMTEHERMLVSLGRDAHAHGWDVRLTHRDSELFGSRQMLVGLHPA